LTDSNVVMVMVMVVVMVMVIVMVMMVAGTLGRAAPPLLD
jgi:hypothetical protein